MSNKKQQQLDKKQSTKSTIGAKDAVERNVNQGQLFNDIASSATAWFSQLANALNATAELTNKHNSAAKGDNLNNDNDAANVNDSSNVTPPNSDNIKENGLHYLIAIYQNFFNNSQQFLVSQQRLYEKELSFWQNMLGFIGGEKRDTKIAVDHNSNNSQTKLGDASNKQAIVQDRRFSDEDWNNNPFFSYIKDSYLKVTQNITDLVYAANGIDANTKERMVFFMRQYLNSISPSNFAFTNPEVIKAAIRTNGASFIQGMQNLLHDMGNGYIMMTDESKFALGSNLACTQGSVIFRNELIELIQYAPTTSKVFARPLLIVPPFINKYYILDLQAHNSLVRYLVDQGFTVFLISWKSADSSTASYRFIDYIHKGVIAALETVRMISKQTQVNALGYCIGGVLLSASYLVLKQQKLDWINAMTHITTMLDHSEPGDIRFFIDRDLVAFNESSNHGHGIISGRVISYTFSALRANELIWNYWINNYLLGKTPKPFDILFWNNDTVDLPISLHAFILKSLYADNILMSDQLVLDGALIQLHDITCPLYIFAAQKDHIVPWKSAFKTINHISSTNIRFVLGSSGHTAGVISPVYNEDNVIMNDNQLRQQEGNKNNDATKQANKQNNSSVGSKHNYWVNSHLKGTTADQWLTNAKKITGSWWPDLVNWLSLHSGDTKNKATKLGNNQFKPLVNAPGEYVKAKGMAPVEAEAIK